MFHKFLLVALATTVGLLADRPVQAADDRGAMTVEIPATDGTEKKLVQLYSKSYALVIGIDKYKGGSKGWPELRGAVKDAEAVAEALDKQGFSVTLKTDLDSADLRTVLQRFLIVTGNDPQARLLIWFAGHGHSIKQPVEEGFLVPADTPQPGSPKDVDPEFVVKAVSMADFTNWMVQSRAKHVLAVFDSCFSGTALRVTRSAPLLAPADITVETGGKSRQIISSGDIDQEVEDRGLFRRLFLDAISGTAPGVGGRGYVTGRELGNYLKREMTTLTMNSAVPQRPNEGYIARYGVNLGDFVFEVVKPDGTRPARPRLPMPTELGVGRAPVTASADTKSFKVDAPCIKEWKDSLITSRNCEALIKFSQKCSGTFEGALAEYEASTDRCKAHQKEEATATRAPGSGKPGIVQRWRESFNTWMKPTPDTPSKPPEPAKPKLPEISKEEKAAWENAKTVNSVASYDKFIAAWPASRHADQAKAERELQLRKKYTLADVFKATASVADAIRSKKLVYEKYELDPTWEDSAGTCKWDARSKSVIRGFALSRLYFYGFMSFLRYGELTRENFGENANIDTKEKVTSNPRVLALELMPASVIDAMRRVRSQKFPYPASELKHIKLLAEELLARKKIHDSLDKHVVEKYLAGQLDNLGLPDHPNACFRMKGLLFKNIGIPNDKDPERKSPEEAVDETESTASGLNFLHSLDDWMDDFWVDRRLEGSQQVAEVILRYIKDE